MPAPVRQPLISIIIPAWNEQHRIAATLNSLHTALKRVIAADEFEIIVVDDGSLDQTYKAASSLAHHVIRHARNQGKGAALESGISASQGRILVFLDADLQETAEHAEVLISPVLTDACDLCIAKLPPARKKGGFGLVKKLASQGIFRLCGFYPSSPLSGQRVMKREVLETTGQLSSGFGIEVGLTIDAVRAGFRVQEVLVPFSHRETGRDLQGFIHRGKQFIEVSHTLFNRWWRPI